MQESGRKIGFLLALKVLGGQLHRHMAVNEFFINLALDQFRGFDQPGRRCCWVGLRCLTCGLPHGQVLPPAFQSLVSEGENSWSVSIGGRSSSLTKPSSVFHALDIFAFDLHHLAVRHSAEAMKAGRSPGKNLEVQISSYK